MPITSNRRKRLSGLLPALFAAAMFAPGGTVCPCTGDFTDVTHRHRLPGVQFTYLNAPPPAPGTKLTAYATSPPLTVTVDIDIEWKIIEGVIGVLLTAVLSGLVVSHWRRGPGGSGPGPG